MTDEESLRLTEKMILKLLLGDPGDARRGFTFDQLVDHVLSNHPSITYQSAMRKTCEVLSTGMLHYCRKSYLLSLSSEWYYIYLERS